MLTSISYLEAEDSYRRERATHALRTHRPEWQESQPSRRTWRRVLHLRPAITR